MLKKNMYKTKTKNRRLDLPKNWWRRWDNRAPGTLQWWSEYYVWKHLGYCNHSYLPRNGKPQKRFCRMHDYMTGWIKTNEHCDIAWQVEKDCLDPTLWQLDPAPEKVVQKILKDLPPESTET